MFNKTIGRSTPTARRRAAARYAKIVVIAVAVVAAAAGAAAFKRSRGQDPESEQVPTAVPHSATGIGPAVDDAPEHEVLIDETASRDPA